MWQMQLWLYITTDCLPILHCTVTIKKKRSWGRFTTRDSKINKGFNTAGCLLPSPPLIWWRWCHYLAAQRWSEISLLLYTLFQTSFYSEKWIIKNKNITHAGHTQDASYNQIVCIQCLFPVISQRVSSTHNTKQNMWLMGGKERLSREMNQTDRYSTSCQPIWFTLAVKETVNSWEIAVQSLSSHHCNNTDHTVKHCPSDRQE